jgi:hypothetical protein
MTNNSILTPCPYFVPVLSAISQAASVPAILTGAENPSGWNTGIAVQP